MAKVMSCAVVGTFTLQSLVLVTSSQSNCFRGNIVTMYFCNMVFMVWVEERRVRLGEWNSRSFLYLDRHGGEAPDD